MWLKNADQPTWERVAAALESRSVNNSRLARDIRVRYCGAADDALRPQDQGKPGVSCASCIPFDLTLKTKRVGNSIIVSLCLLLFALFVPNPYCIFSV